MTGVTFGDNHSYIDYGLILTDVSLTPPSTQTETVSVPGRNGALDLTDAIYEIPVYDNRTLTLTFVLPRAKSRWRDSFEILMNDLHGQRMQISIDDDADYYYYGRVEINKYESDRNKGTYTIVADCEPYKYYADETVIEVTSPATVTLPCDRMPAVPTLVTDAEITIVCGSLTTTLSAGTWTMTALPLSQGGAEWEISGEANVTISYRQGRL